MPEQFAAGCLLPTTGISAWKLRINADERRRVTRSAATSTSVGYGKVARNNGYMDLGVCGADCKQAWGFNLHTGNLRRVGVGLQSSLWHPVDPPAGFPDGDGTQVSHNLQGQTFGAEIEVIVDHDAGTLSFQINDGPPILALSGFPQGAALRPHASLFFSTLDKVTFVRGYL